MVPGKAHILPLSFYFALHILKRISFAFSKSNDLCFSYSHSFLQYFSNYAVLKKQKMDYSLTK